MQLKIYKRYLKVKKYKNLFAKLYPNKSEKELMSDLKQLVKNRNYRLIVAFFNKKPVGMVSIHTGFALYCKKFIRISSLYVEPEYRNKRVAQKLIKEIEEIGKRLGCQRLVLDTYIDNKDSHKLYFREDFEIIAYHFSKEI